MRNSVFVVFFAIFLAASLSYAAHPVQAMPYSREDIAALNRGYTYLRRRNYDRVIVEYSAVLRMHPNSVNAWSIEAWHISEEGIMTGLPLTLRLCCVWNRIAPTQGMVWHTPKLQGQGGFNNSERSLHRRKGSNLW